MRVRATLTALVALAVVSTAAEAQRGVRTSSAPARSGSMPFEVGFDAAYSMGLDDQGNVLSLPIQAVRFAYPISPALSIEPALGFARLSGDGGSASGMNLDVGVLYHLGLDRSQRQLFIRPVLGVHREAESTKNPTTGASTSTSLTRMSFGAGFGAKFPIFPAVAARVEGQYRHLNKKEQLPSMAALNLMAGLSFFFR